jgi:hypothetical protein
MWSTIGTLAPTRRLGRARPRGTSGFFATVGVDGETDEELQAAVEAGFIFTSNSLTLDGRALPLKTIDAGAFDVTSESGSFHDAVFGLTGPVRSALRGNIVVLHPLTPAIT